MRLLGQLLPGQLLPGLGQLLRGQLLLGQLLPGLGQLLLGPGQLLLGLGLVAGGRAAPHDTLACSQGLTCRLLDTDVLCGMEPPGPSHGLALSQLQLEPALRCSRSAGCSPCLEARLRLALPPGPGSSAAEPDLPVPSGIPGAGDGGEAGQWSAVGRATSYQPNITGLVLLFGHAYTSSRCVVVEVQATPTPALPGQPLGWVTFRCFEAPLGSELHVIAYSSSHQRLSQRQRVPDCSWPIAQNAVPQCQAPRLQVSSGPKEVVVMVQGTTAGHSYTLRLYYNQSRGTSETGHAVTASSPMNYSVPASKVLPCLCLQVWPETQDPLRTTLCPFSHDAEAWERLWARSQLVLHTTGQALSCSLLSPCDLSAELVPCWQPVPPESCQALPGLQQPAVGQEPQEFGGLRPHPNLCIQVWSGGQVQLTQCLRDRALPGRPDDVLLLEHGGNTNASLCALEQGACALLSSFTSVGVGHPGLLEQELQRDVAEGQCRQIWHSENNTTIRLWACPLHKYLRTRWALAWMGVLLGAASLLLLFLLKKEDVKGWLKSLRAGYSSEGPLRGRRALLLHAAEPVAERAVCALMTALHPLGLTVAAAPGGGSGVAALGPLPWLHAQHQRALRDDDTIVFLLSPAGAAAAYRWDAEARTVSGTGDAESVPSLWHGAGLSDVSAVAPCEAFAAALSCAMPALASGNGRYVVVRLETLVPEVPLALQAAPAFALPSEMGGFLWALAGPGQRQGRQLEPYVAAVAKGLQQALGE